jgi:hypothetical protein
MPPIVWSSQEFESYILILIFSCLYLDLGNNFVLVMPYSHHLLERNYPKGSNSMRCRIFLYVVTCANWINSLFSFEIGK